MKKIFLFTLFAFASFLTQTSAQTKMLTLEDAVLRQRSTLGPERLAQLQWVGNTDNYCYVVPKRGREILMLSSVAEAEPKEFLSSDFFNAKLQELDMPPLERFPELKWKDDSTLQFVHANRIIWYNTNNKSIRTSATWDDRAENLDFEPKNNHIAFTIENQLYLLKGSGERVSVVNDENKGIVYGQSVHRNEYGITKGTFWSPLGNMLAFYRMDESMVTDYPIVNTEQRPASFKLIKYPMAGMNSHEVLVGIYNVNTGGLVYLNTGEPKDQYLTNITWSLDEQWVYVAVLNRETNLMKLNKYNAYTGSFVKTLFEEKSEKYVEPLHGLKFLPSGKHFVWLSQRDGFNHAYLYDNEGTLVTQLTKGNWDIIDFAGFSMDGKNMFFTATKESPIERHLYQVEINPKSKKQPSIKLLTTNNGTHTTLLNAKKTMFIDQLTSLTIPRTINIFDTKGNAQKHLLFSKNPLAEYQLGNTSIGTITTKDNITLYYRLILPPNFDAKKKYPSITYVYNGPHVQLVNNAWLGGGDMWLQYMAQQGYVMFTLDGRGSDNRGRDFEQAVHRQLGTPELEDQIAGNDFLRGLAYVDTSRMGVFGWSYGGFMTTGLMTRTPGHYQVGVAGGPVIDWKYYEVMYTERYMDMPQENEAGYEKANLLNYIENLKGKLMLIHGTSDDVVVWQHSLMYLDKCIEKKKQIDYFVYPGHQHNVLGIDRAHLMQKVTDYFKQNL